MGSNYAALVIGRRWATSKKRCWVNFNRNTTVQFSMQRQPADKHFCGNVIKLLLNSRPASKALSAGARYVLGPGISLQLALLHVYTTLNFKNTQSLQRNN